MGGASDKVEPGGHQKPSHNHGPGVWPITTLDRMEYMGREADSELGWRWRPLGKQQFPRSAAQNRGRDSVD